MMSEFYGATLMDTMHEAGTDYRAVPVLEHQKICSDLAIDLQAFKRQAGRALDRAEALRRDADALAQSAR